MLKESFAIVGAGKVGTGIGIALRDAGLRLVGICDVDSNVAENAAALLGARVASSPVEAAAMGDAVVITTPDDRIEEVCREIAGSGIDIVDKIFIHMSGALSLDALLPAALNGARTACIHPIQTFADMETAAKLLRGSFFGITAADEASRGWAWEFVEKIGGKGLEIRNDDRVLYHLAAVIASNFLVMIEHAAISVFEKIAVERHKAVEALMPLIRQTVDNIERFGVLNALTGPLARGDTGTIRSHLKSLEREPELESLYKSVCKWGARIVKERGELEDGVINEIVRLLGGRVADT